MKKILLSSVLLPLMIACNIPKDMEIVSTFPPIWPDYTDVTVPVDIAPLNFCAAKDSGCERILLVVSDWFGKNLLNLSGKDCIVFPEKKWHEILSRNMGGPVMMQVAMCIDGKWKSYKKFAVNVSHDSIDYGITYRKILPGYQAFGHMGIYERDLSSYKERLIMDSRMTDSGCLNCHTPNKADPSSYSIHVRGTHSATLLHHDGITECLDTKTDSTSGFFAYPYWHPSGKYIAYSVNTTRQSFYSAMDKRIEVYDEASDVIVYKPETHEVLLCDQLRRKDKFETYPAFSPDGKSLYFCVADAGNLPEDREKMIYSVCKIGFDPETGTFGDQIDTVVSGHHHHKSFSTPRPSYDGQYILFAGADYGTFPIWHKEADLWIYSIGMDAFRPVVEVNSDDTESFHNWSSNSRWVVFSSRRDTGLYTRLYIAHVDEEGVFGKPVLLPQRNPRKYYDELEYSYNIPDFTTEPVELDVRDVSKTLLSPERTGVKVRSDK